MVGRELIVEGPIALASVAVFAGIVVKYGSLPDRCVSAGRLALQVSPFLGCLGVVASLVCELLCVAVGISSMHEVFSSSESVESRDTYAEDESRATSHAFMVAFVDFCRRTAPVLRFLTGASEEQSEASIQELERDMLRFMSRTGDMGGSLHNSTGGDVSFPHRPMDRLGAAHDRVPVSSSVQSGSFDAYSESDEFSQSDSDDACSESGESSQSDSDDSQTGTSDYRFFRGIPFVRTGTVTPETRVPAPWPLAASPIDLLPQVFRQPSHSEIGPDAETARHCDDPGAIAGDSDEENAH